MAIHSSILAWISPGTEEPGGPSPWGHKQSDVTEHAHFVCFMSQSYWPTTQGTVIEHFQLFFTVLCVYVFNL